MTAAAMPIATPPSATTTSCPLSASGAIAAPRLERGRERDIQDHRHAVVEQRLALDGQGEFVRNR